MPPSAAAIVMLLTAIAHSGSPLTWNSWNRSPRFLFAVRRSYPVCSSPNARVKALSIISSIGRLNVVVVGTLKSSSRIYCKPPVRHVSDECSDDHKRYAQELPQHADDLVRRFGLQ